MSDDGDSLAKQADDAKPGFAKAALYTKAATAFMKASREALAKKDLKAANWLMSRSNEMGDRRDDAEREATEQLRTLRAKVALQKKPKAAAVRKWAGKPSND